MSLRGSLVASFQPFRFTTKCGDNQYNESFLLKNLLKETFVAVKENWFQWEVEKKAKRIIKK